MLAPLSQLATLVAGRLPAPPRHGKEGSVRRRVVTLRALGEGRWMSEGMDEVEVDWPSLDERRVLQTGDVVVAARGGGFSALAVTPEAAGALLGANLILIRPHDQLVGPVLAAYFRSPLGKAQIEAAARSSAGMLNLSVKELETLPLCVPEPAELRRLAALIEAADACHAQALAAARIRRELALSLIHDAMRPGAPIPDARQKEEGK